MATEQWIDSAMSTRKPHVGGGMDGNYQHTLVMARADEDREERDRVLAALAVRRIAGGDAAEVLAMLGLGVGP